MPENEEPNEPVNEPEPDLNEPDRAILERIEKLEDENGKLKSKIRLYEKLQPVPEDQPKEKEKIDPVDSVMKEMNHKGWIL